MLHGKAVISLRIVKTDLHNVAERGLFRIPFDNTPFSLTQARGDLLTKVTPVYTDIMATDEPTDYKIRCL